MIAGLLLASGSARRFGSDKLVAPLRGIPLIVHAAAVLRGAVDELHVVTAPEHSARRRLLAALDVHHVSNPAAAEGMASAIRAGIAALPPHADAAVIALADQPTVAADVVRRLVARWRRGDAVAVSPGYAGGRGHPVLFDRRAFAALQRLTGDAGARDLLASLEPAVALVRMPGAAPRDVDTPDDLAELENGESP